MYSIPRIVPVSDLRKDAAAVLADLESDAAPMVITQRSHAVAVLIGVTQYERMVREREVLGILAKGEQDIASAKGLSLDAVIADVNRRLGREESA